MKKRVPCLKKYDMDTNFLKAIPNTLKAKSGGLTNILGKG